MSALETYRSQALDYLPIFHQPFYLDVVAKDKWDVVVVEKDHKIVASLPFLKHESKGYTNLIQPSLTQFLGPCIDPAYIERNKLKKEKRLLTALAEQLPPHSTYDQCWHYSLQNWLPFYWLGYNQTTRYTYVLEDLSDLDKVWGGLDNEIRRNIKKAEDAFRIKKGENTAGIHQLVEQTYQRKQVNDYENLKYLEALFSACQKRDCGQILEAHDASGHLAAACLLIWDKQACYYLLGGKSTERAHQSAVSLLLWQGIQDAAKRQLAFDFEGSMVPSIENFFSDFGAEQQPYFSVTKVNSKKISIINHLKGLKENIFSK